MCHNPFGKPFCIFMRAAVLFCRHRKARDLETVTGQDQRKENDDMEAVFHRANIQILSVTPRR